MGKTSLGLFLRPPPLYYLPVF